MDDPADLTEAQLDELRADLLSLRADLEAMLTASAQSARTVDLDQPIGRLSRMDALQGQQMASATLRRTRARLQQVLAALARFDTGEYGFCLRSGEPIGFRRLKARPETPFSLETQARLERRG